MCESHQNELGGGGVDAENLKVVPDHCRSTIMYVISILSVIRLMMLTYDLWASLSAPSELLVFGSLMPARSFLTLLSTDPSNAPRRHPSLQCAQTAPQRPVVRINVENAQLDPEPTPVGLVYRTELSPASCPSGSVYVLV